MWKEIIKLPRIIPDVSENRPLSWNPDYHMIFLFMLLLDIQNIQELLLIDIISRSIMNSKVSK